MTIVIDTEIIELFRIQWWHLQCKFDIKVFDLNIQRGVFPMYKSNTLVVHCSKFARNEKKEHACDCFINRSFPWKIYCYLK